MITFIKWCLGLGLDKEDQKYQRARYLRYPETYHLWQMQDAEKILEFFKDISLGITGEKALEVRLENKNMVIIMPIKESSIIGASNIPNTHKTRWGKESLIIEPKRKFRKTFPYVLIIRRIFKPAI